MGVSLKTARVQIFFLEDTREGRFEVTLRIKAKAMSNFRTWFYFIFRVNTAYLW